MKEGAIYLPGLNGIRAIAALAVVVSHVTMGLHQFGLNTFLFGEVDGEPRNYDLAWHGVSMFFVLSGFLITYLLCQEKSEAPVNIKKFYMRRILRIWPLYYAYLLIIVIVYLIFQLDFQGATILYYIFYTANIPFTLGNALLLLSHYWSLGVEKQFYLMWPWITRLSIKRMTIVSIILLITLLGLKSVLHLIYPGTLLESFMNITRFQCMLFGCVAALLFYQKNQLLSIISANKIVQIFCWICLLLVALNYFHIASFLDTEIFSAITAIMILGQINGASPIKLENKLFDFLGKNSYGIYVIHPLIIFILAKALPKMPIDNPLSYVSVFTLVIGLTIGISHLSFKYYESFFLKIKKRKFTVVPSRAHMRN